MATQPECGEPAEVSALARDDHADLAFGQLAHVAHCFGPAGTGRIMLHTCVTGSTFDSQAAQHHGWQLDDISSILLLLTGRGYQLTSAQAAVWARRMVTVQAVSASAIVVDQAVLATAVTLAHFSSC